MSANININAEQAAMLAPLIQGEITDLETRANGLILRTNNRRAGMKVLADRDQLADLLDQLNANFDLGDDE